MVNGSAKTAVGASKLVNSEREDKVSAQTVRRALREQSLKAIKKEETKAVKSSSESSLELGFMPRKLDERRLEKGDLVRRNQNKQAK
ncbi:hypothetical protein K3495_g14894 [Podosphaera aphanis]|nr:hypothetical protein K3495_g14894 [Podosphaera aphanis]